MVSLGFAPYLDWASSDLALAGFVAYTSPIDGLYPTYPSGKGW